MGMWRAAAIGAMTWSLLFGARSAGADDPKDCAPCKSSGDCLPAGHPGRTFSGADDSFTNGLIEILENDRDEEHRLAAVAQLVQVPRYRPEILRALEEASRMDPSIHVRRAAMLGVPRYRVASKIAKMSNETERASLKRPRAPQSLLSNLVPSEKPNASLAASSKPGAKRKPTTGAKAPGAGTAVAKTPKKPRQATGAGKAVAKATPKSSARPMQPRPSRPEQKEIVTVRRHEAPPAVAPVAIPSFRFTNDGDSEPGTITITEAEPAQEPEAADPTRGELEVPEVLDAELVAEEALTPESEMEFTNDAESSEAGEPGPVDAEVAATVPLAASNDEPSDEVAAAALKESLEPAISDRPEPMEFTNDSESVGEPPAAESNVARESSPPSPEHPIETTVADVKDGDGEPSSSDATLGEQSYPLPSGRERVGGPGPVDVASAPSAVPAPPAPVTPDGPVAVSAIVPAAPEPTPAVVAIPDMERPMDPPARSAEPKESRTSVERSPPVPHFPSGTPMQRQKPVATRPRPPAGPKSAFTSLIAEAEGPREKTRNTRRVVSDPRRSLATLEDRLAHRPESTFRPPAPGQANEFGNRGDAVRSTQRVVSSPASRKGTAPAADAGALAASHALSRAGRDLVARRAQTHDIKPDPAPPSETATVGIPPEPRAVAADSVSPTEPSIVPPPPVRKETTVANTETAGSPYSTPSAAEPCRPMAAATEPAAAAEFANEGPKQLVAAAPTTDPAPATAPAPVPVIPGPEEPPRWTPQWTKETSAARTEPSPPVSSPGSTAVPVAKTVLARTDAPPILRAHGLEESSKPKTPAMLSLEAVAPKLGSRKRFASPIKIPVASVTPTPAPSISAPPAPPTPAAMEVAVEKLPALQNEPEPTGSPVLPATESAEPVKPVAVGTDAAKHKSGDVVAAMGAESDETDAVEAESEAEPEAPSLFETPRLGTVLAREARPVHRPELGLAAVSAPPALGEKGDASSHGAVASSPPPVPGKARAEKRRGGERNRASVVRQSAQTVAYVVPPGSGTPMAVPLTGAGGNGESDEELAERLVHQCKSCISDQRFDEAEMLIYRIRDLDVDWDEFETSPRDLLLELSQARFEPGGK